jgi:hypothetical protein
MNWKWFSITYLTVGILLAQGFIYESNKSKTPVTVYQYLVALLLGPITVWPIMIFQALRKKPK